MSVTVTMQGFRELDQALAQFTKASARNILKRAAIEAIQPMADEMERRAPERANGGGNLKEAIAVGDKLGKRQKRAARRAGNNSHVEIYAGVADVAGGHLPSGVQQEFGNENHAPQPFVRPAWDQEARATLARLLITLEAEINRAIARAQRRTARAAARAARAASPPSAPRTPGVP